VNKKDKSNTKVCPKGRILPNKGQRQLWMLLGYAENRSLESKIKTMLEKNLRYSRFDSSKSKSRTSTNFGRYQTTQNGRQQFVVATVTTISCSLGRQYRLVLSLSFLDVCGLHLHIV